MNEKDNVATTLCPLVQGQKAYVKTISGELMIGLQEAVPPNHKFAIHDIRSGEHVLKFGEIIGIATEDIRRGTHVHTRNLRSLHGRGNEQTSS
jgi:altronate dehydratase small subunit